MSLNKNILIDYDNTYSEMPEVFSSFIAMAQAAGFICYIVTMRPPEHPVLDAPDDVEVIYTARKAKIPYCREFHNLSFGIFIEDTPIRLYMDYETETSIVNSHGK